MSEQFNNEEVTVTLTLDDDTELECAVLTIYEVDGQEYIAFFQWTMLKTKMVMFTFTVTLK